MRGVSRDSLAALQARVDELVRAGNVGDQHELSSELFAVVRLLHVQPRLRRMVSDPAVAGERRASLLGDLLADHVSAPAAQVAQALASSSWARPSDIVEAADECAAQVLFGAAEQDDSLDEVEDELFRFARILEREPRLRSALTDPALPADRKTALLDGLLAGRVHDATRLLVGEAILHPRGRTIERGLEEYGQLAAARRERLVARVRSVVPLTEEQQSRLSEAVAAQVGHRVHLNVEIDPAIEGGLTVRVGDELFDGSITHRLAAVRRLMAG